jgi:hypothetical protein
LYLRKAGHPFEGERKMQDDLNGGDKTIRGWKALAIVLGAAAFVLFATWAMNDRDRHSGMAQSSETGTTVGLAPQR